MKKSYDPGTKKTRETSLSRRALLRSAVATMTAGCALAPVRALADNREVMAYSLDDAGNRKNYYTTDDAISAGYEGKVIYLDVDWMFTGTMTVADSKSLTIDMNGHKITSQGGGAVIRMYEHSSLTLKGGITKVIDYLGFDPSLGRKFWYGVRTGGLITGGYDKSNGGGIRMDADSTLTLDNVAVAGNESSYDVTGGIYVKGNCTINMKNNAVVERNKGGAGGILVSGDDVNIFMDNASIRKNYGTVYGGGLSSRADGTRIHLENGSSVCDNTAVSGGGLHFGYSFFNAVSDDGTGSVKNNYARTYDSVGGGGICVQEKKAAQNEGEIRGLTVSGNTSESDCGGIYMEQRWVQIKNCTITDNEAVQRGGGAFIAAENVTMDSCTVTGNVCNSVYGGGGVYVAHGTDLNLVGLCNITGNTRGGDGSSDNLYIATDGHAANSYFHGGVIEGSRVGLRSGFLDDRELGHNITYYADDTYFMDLETEYRASHEGSSIYQRVSISGGASVLYNYDDAGNDAEVTAA